jgi:hypothetical protein
MPYIDGRRAVAVAPDSEGERLPELTTVDRDLDAKCEAWVAWCRTRRLYGPTPMSGSVLGKMMGGGSRPLRPPSDVVCSAELAAFHIAYTCQPDALDKRVFDLYYVHRVKPVKRAADALKLSRAHFYRLLQEFRRRVNAAGAAVLAKNDAELSALGFKRDSATDVND